MLIYVLYVSVAQLYRTNLKYHVTWAMGKYIFRHMRIANARIRLRICAVWFGPSLSAFWIIRYCRIYRCITKVIIRLYGITVPICPEKNICFFFGAVHVLKYSDRHLPGNSYTFKGKVVFAPFWKGIYSKRLKGEPILSFLSRPHFRRVQKCNLIRKPEVTKIVLLTVHAK